jgi:hypothetical protein
MSSKKHNDTVIDLNKPYEENDIQLKGIIGFGIGLFLLIVVTFSLMYALLNVLKDYAAEGVVQNPVGLRDRERLPPEPRLQAAPGWEIDTSNGKINLELGDPRSEYWELSRDWQQLWDFGRKDAKTGVVTALPINEAKQKVLSQNLKAKSGAEAEELLKNSKLYVTDASSGRVASLNRR